MLKEAVPAVVRIAVLHEWANPGSLRELKDVLPVAERALGLTVRSWEVRGSDGFEKIFAALTKERPDGLYVTTSPLMTANLKRTVGFALKSRLPSVGSNIQYVEAGGLMSYDADPADSYRRVAWYLGQDPQGRQARRSPRRTAVEVRAGHESEDGKANWSDDPAECAGASGQSDQVNL